MFGKKAQPPIKSLIAQGTRIEGDVHFAEGMRIDGEVVGDIRAGSEQPSILVISELASVTGQIHADHVIINGTVKGPVEARQLLELQSKAKIEGEVQYAAVMMEHGATILGQLRPMVAGADAAEEGKPSIRLAARSA